MTADRFGVTWLDDHGDEILAASGSFDFVEVVVDDRAAGDRRRIGALRELGRQVPVRLHGVSLGLASTERADEGRLSAFARLVGAVEPESWSEHLAFVRGGGVAIGHLAAPAWRPDTAEGAVRNLAMAARTVGSAPLVENVATLCRPPGSVWSEARWLADVASAAGSAVLLDLHNLHANAANACTDTDSVLAALAPRVAEVHVAGGRVVGGTANPRILDDHLHDVPAPVYALLERAARAAPRPLAVVIERDGRWPGIDGILAQVRASREAVARGRSQRRAAS